jgi:hypothetical protein
MILVVAVLLLGECGECFRPDVCRRAVRAHSTGACQRPGQLDSDLLADPGVGGGHGCLLHRTGDRPTQAGPHYQPRKDHRGDGGQRGSSLRQQYMLSSCPWW